MNGNSLVLRNAGQSGSGLQVLIEATGDGGVQFTKLITVYEGGSPMHD